MKRFIWFILTMALLPVSAFASRDSTATDTLVVAPFTQGSKTKRVLLVRAGAWISAIGRVEVDTLKSRSGATIILQGNFVDAAGTQQNYVHLQADSLSSDSLTVTGNGVVTGNFAIQGGTTIGNASGDALTYHPSAWTLTNAVTITGTWTNLGTVTTVDVNGGTGDAFIIGGSSAAAGTFTTLTANDSTKALGGFRTTAAEFTTGAYLGGGIAAANLLDDYEEGTFTPALEFGDATTDITYDNRSGRYTKIGNVVFFNISLKLTSNGTATGTATISGLPFTSIGTPDNGWTLGTWSSITMNTAGNFYTPTLYLSIGTEMTFYESGSGVSATAMTDADFADTAEFRVSGHYYVTP